ncbi:unnamed protein product [Symbiodinium sp. CCMP2456]|nr:unnamed protein product [Symbiodinium sp. CCMP2456]
MLWAQALALCLHVGLGQQVEVDALRVHFTEQALVLEVRSQARQVAEGSSFSNLSGPLSVLRLLESQLADLKGRDTIVELNATQNLTEIRAEAVQLECAADHLLADLSKVLEASERLALAENRTMALGDAVRQSRSEGSAHAGGAHSCGERHRLRRRLQQLHEEARSMAEEKEDMERLLDTMHVHVSRIREEAVQGRRALNATRALEALASKDVLEKEHGYQKALEELTHLNEVVHATRRRERRQSDNGGPGTPRNRSEPDGSAKASRDNARDAAERAQVVETPRPPNETDSGVEKLIQVHLLRAHKPEASTGFSPDISDESFHKGRQDARKTPCHKHRSSLPGHVDGFPAEPDLGSTPEVSAEPSTSPTTTTSFSTSTSMTQASTTHKKLPASMPRQEDSAEPEEDLSNRAVPGKPDPAIDAAAESIHPEDAPSRTLPPTTSLPKPPRIHEETWPIQYEDGEWGTKRGPPLVASTTGPSSPNWYEEADWGELWPEQERLARQLPDLYRRWEAAQNHTRGMLKACLVAEDAERQLRAAVDYHLKAIQLVSAHFNATKAKLLRLRGRARIARDALERLPRCRRAGKRRHEDLETKLKEATRHLESLRAQVKALERAVAPSWKQLQAGLANLRALSQAHRQGPGPGFPNAGERSA